MSIVDIALNYRAKNMAEFIVISLSVLSSVPDQLDVDHN